MKFSEIYQRAVDNRGGPKTLEAELPVPKPANELVALGNDRYLACFTKQIFRAGFVWKVVDAKWDDFETVFLGFDPARILALNDEDLERIGQDRRVIRNHFKIRAIQENALFIDDVCREAGSFGRFLADWPVTDITGLWQVLKTRGARLGGMTGPYALRMLGKDTFLLSTDVVKGLIVAGVVERSPTTKKELSATQRAFNDWMEETDLSHCQLSRILAISVGI